MTESTSIISLRNMNKWYGQFHVLRDINLAVRERERIVICGPSGSGKSTLIRCINRLEAHQSGEIEVGGILLTDDLKKLDAIRREVGMVFQHFNLFPHLTVLENCTLAPMRVRGMPAEAGRWRWSISPCIQSGDKYPGQSGGRNSGSPSPLFDHAAQNYAL